jgi:hypothetical protein
MEDGIQDVMQPGVRWAQQKLEEVAKYLDDLSELKNIWSPWKPIKTAPTDGSLILAITSGGHYWLVKWNGEEWDDNENYDPDVVWWLPLPEGPE